MNKVVLCGRLTNDIDLKYSSKDNSMAIARYTIAVDTGYGDNKRTEFIRCVAFGKAGEFASKYFQKGKRVLVEGRIQIDKSEKDGKTIYYTNIIVESQEFADAKGEAKPVTNPADGFEPVEETTEDILPFT